MTEKTKSEAVAKAFDAFCKEHDLETYVAVFELEDGYRTVIHAGYEEVFSMIHGLHVTLHRGMKEQERQFMEAMLAAAPIGGEA
jgi:hypothetical protein